MAAELGDDRDWLLAAALGLSAEDVSEIDYELDAETEAAELARKRIEELEERKRKIFDKMLDDKIKQDVYEEQTSKIDADLADLRLVRSNSVPAETELDRLLEFAEWFLNNVATVWMGAEPRPKASHPAGCVPVRCGIHERRISNPTRSLLLQ